MDDFLDITEGKQAPSPGDLYKGIPNVPFKQGDVLRQTGENSYDKVQNAVKKDTLPKEFDFVPKLMGEIDQKLAKAKTEEETVKDKPKEESKTGLNVPKSNCPHCGWDLSRDETEVPTEEDKLNFVQAILGQIPFKKSYELFKGKLQVEFRTLTSEEVDMSFTQVAYDSKKANNMQPDEYFRTLIDYRMCLSLVRVAVQDQPCITLPSHVDKWKVKDLDSNSTKLVKIVPYVYSNVLKTEQIRSLVVKTFFRFQRLYENLEARASDPNFW